MSSTRVTAIRAAFLGAMVFSSAPAFADADPAFDGALHDLEIRWETVKFTIPPGDKQTAEMEKVGAEADALLARYPTRVEAEIWDGILKSEQASMASAFSALSLVKQAKVTLEKAYAENPTALNAGAPASLGVLYYRVPGFPIAFGDNQKARALLEQATSSAPQGLDAWYFYGDFLMNQGENDKARQVFTYALSIPESPLRPLWDKSRRQVIKEDLAKLQAKT
ncbi:tetratricopeptide repeat protein [Pleomorphomonas sp. PLEO]|uniref:tetratricopeptide repeat protein n=1 Tax=Pleomorphomonas sp. PLEO TaxID=3239306 RepID=UPI00351DE032